MKICCLRSSKLSKNKLAGIMVIFGDYLNVIKSFFPFARVRITQKFHLA